MLAVTQFEVHVYQQGRWSIHARYPNSEREEAVRDAVATGSVASCPTKVIRETYFPETNSTETVTIYVSPKAKALRARASLPHKALPSDEHVAANRYSEGKSRQTARQRLSARNVFFRIVIAAAISVTTTTLIVGVLAWMLRRFADAGVALSGAMTSTVLTYGYVAIFLFSFGSLFRSRLPLHRVLVDLWASAQEDNSAKSNQVRARPLPKLKPKHDRAASPEYLREWQEMKVRRGDLDTLDPPDSVDAVAEATIGEPAAPETGESTPEPKPEPQSEEKKNAIEANISAPSEPGPDKATVTPNISLETPAGGGHDSDQPPAQSGMETTADAGEDDARHLERTILLRFTKDVVKTVLDTMPDDPVTRRGGALVLAGAASALTRTSEHSANADLTLLSDIANATHTTPYLTEAFLSQYSDHVMAEENTPVVEIGREIMARYLAGEAQLVGTLTATLSEWRTPFSRPPGTHAHNDALPAASIVPSLLGVYLLTEVRHNAWVGPDSNDEVQAQVAHDAAMGAHNTIVRASILACRGDEITHTGKGIFAQFNAPEDALDAAADIQRQFGVKYGAAVAIGVIGNTDIDADPNFSPALSRHAQAVVSKAGGGEILCERRVQLEAKSPRSTEYVNLRDDQADESSAVDPLITIAVETIPSATFESARVS
jgi:adenylate cyclase